MTVRTALVVFAVGVILTGCSRDVQPPEPPDDVTEAMVSERIAGATEAVLAEPESARAWGRLGNVYDVHRYFDRALECYARATELDPENWRWPYFSGIVLRENDQAAALDAFTRAASLKDDYPPLQLYLGFGHFLAENVDRAAEHYARALEIDGDSINARIGLARVALARRDVDTAVTLLEEAVALAPDEAAVHHHLAHAYGLKGDTEAAESRRRLAETSGVPMQPGEMASFLDPVRDEVTLREGVSSSWLLTNGQRHLAAGRPTEARDLFDRLLAANPDSVAGLLASSRLAIGSGDIHRAMELVQRAIELAPGDAATHAELGLVLARVGRIPQAIEAYRQALQIDPDLPDAHSNLATLLFQAGRVDEGTALLSAAAERYPGRPDIQLNLANVYLMTGKEETAEKTLREAIAVNPRYVAFRHLLGVVQAGRGRVHDAVATFRDALEVDPADAEVHSGLANALWELKRYGEAIESYGEAYRLGSDDPATALDYAWSLAVCPTDDDRDGARALSMALQLNQQTQFNDPRFLDLLAVAQAESGDYKDAVTTMDKALEIVDGTLSQIAGRLDPRQVQQMKLFGEGLRQRRDLFRAGRPYREP